MKKKLKKICIGGLIFSTSLVGCSGNSSEMASINSINSNTEKDTKEDIKITQEATTEQTTEDIQKIIELQNAEAYENYKITEVIGEIWIDESIFSLENEMLFINSRLYLSSDVMQEVVEGSKKLSNQNLLYDTVVYNNQTYFSINDISNQLNLWTTFKDTGIIFYTDYELLDLENPEENTPELKEALGMACIRFEDIMADPSKDSNFSHEKLEKFRYIGSWLSSRGQEYSIAWIPLCTIPELDIENDLLEMHNFYNAGYIYTMDYLVANGASIGIHGLTHQSGDEASAVGDEFGVNTIFSDEEIIERLLRAIDILEQLGYTPEFFEFPHYATTPEQLLIVENIFDIIYQQFPESSNIGNLELLERNGSKTLYVPTPADHVLSIYDKDGTIDRINNLPKDYLVSLFVHPNLD